MSAVLVAHGAVPFADATAGRAVDLGSAPTVGDVDVVGIISVTVIDSVSGFGAPLDAHLNADDVRTYSRPAVGGEGSTFTVDTSGNFETLVLWQRWRGLSALDVHALAVLDQVSAVSTPPGSTGALAAAGELVVAFGLGSSTQSGNQVGSWPAGWTVVDESRLDSGTFGVYGSSAYKVPATQAGETVSLSWTGDGIFHNHTGLVAYGVTPASSGVDPAVLLGRRRGGRR